MTTPGGGGSFAVETSALYALAVETRTEAASVRELAGTVRAAWACGSGSALLDAAVTGFVTSYGAALDGLAAATSTTAADVTAAAGEYEATDQDAMAGGRAR